MSANNDMYMEMFGNIKEQSMAMAKCACVACNSCTCQCSCRKTPDFDDVDMDW